MTTHTATKSRSMVQLGLRIITAGCLLESAYVHIHLASTYDPVRNGPGALLSQGTLFRVEAFSALAVAVTLLFVNRSIVWLSAAAVGLGSFAAVMTYRYVNVGSIGPVPNMYEPTWFKLKTISAIVEAAAGVLVLAHFTLRRLRA